MAQLPEDIWCTEDMMRSGALAGEGFALDEFTPQGTFNRKFLRYSTVIVAEDSSGIIGAVIQGTLCLMRVQIKKNKHKRQYLYSPET